MDEMSKPAVFDRDPIGVCTFYENRRQMARVVQPNAGHYALAALAQAKPNFLAVTQNVDGMYVQTRASNWLISSVSRAVRES